MIFDYSQSLPGVLVKGSTGKRSNHAAVARTPAAKQSCEQAINPCELGGEECKFLACVDDRIGNFTDNRIIMVGK